MQYRVMSNGKKFKVQWRWLLFWSDCTKVAPPGRIVSRVFDSRDDAMAFIVEDCRRALPWVEVLRWQVR